MIKEKLKGMDYIKRPYLELLSHPDFSPYAYRVIEAIVRMSTEEIDKINLLNTGETNG